MRDTVKRRPEGLNALWEAYERLGSVGLRDQLFYSYVYIVEVTVSFFLRGCWGKWRQLDEMRAEATVALLEAIDRFDLTRGVNFETFAFNAVRGSVRDWLRGVRGCRLHMTQGHVYYRRERPFTDTRLPERQIPDRHSADPVATAELRDFFETALRRCTPREQQILDLYYRHCLSQHEISRRLGVTQGYVCKVYRQAHGRLRRCFGAHVNRWLT